MEKETQIVIVIFVIFGIIMVMGFSLKQKQINNFDQCVAAGNPITESYPRQCKVDDKVFIEDVITIMEDFGSKIVYTTSSTSSNASLFEQDCEKRRGTFNFCGNVCSPDTEICAEICAYTCEDISDKTDLLIKAEDFCNQENVSNVLLCPEFLKVSFKNFVGSTSYHLSNGTTVFCPTVSPIDTTNQCKEFFYITENPEKICKEIC